VLFLLGNEQTLYNWDFPLKIEILKTFNITSYNHLKTVKTKHHAVKMQSENDVIL